MTGQAVALFVAAHLLGPHQQQVATFKGYQCGGSCSGHIAGYQWAMANGITDPGVCEVLISQGRQSFGEGCMAWVREAQ